MAVRLLGRRVRDAEGQASLIRWVSDHEGREALGGIWALSQGEGWSKDYGESLLEHSYPPVRSWAVRILGDRGATESVARMRELAKHENNLEVTSVSSNYNRQNLSTILYPHNSILIKDI